MKISFDDLDPLLKIAFNGFFKFQERQAKALEIIANELMEINQVLKLQSCKEKANEK